MVNQGRTSIQFWCTLENILKNALETYNLTGNRADMEIHLSIHNTGAFYPDIDYATAQFYSGLDDIERGESQHLFQQINQFINDPIQRREYLLYDVGQGLENWEVIVKYARERLALADPFVTLQDVCDRAKRDSRLNDKTPDELFTFYKATVCKMIDMSLDFSRN